MVSVFCTCRILIFDKNKPIAKLGEFEKMSDLRGVANFKVGGFDRIYYNSIKSDISLKLLHSDFKFLINLILTSLRIFPNYIQLYFTFKY